LAEKLDNRNVESFSSFGPFSPVLIRNVPIIGVYMGVEESPEQGESAESGRITVINVPERLTHRGYTLGF